MSDDYKDTILFILHDIKNEIHSLDKKWESSSNSAGRSDEKLSALGAEVHLLNKLVYRGNGKPSLLVQVSNMERKLDNLAKSQQHHAQSVERDLEDIKKCVGLKTPKAVKVERLKLAGKLLALFAAALPGLLALLS